MPVIDYANVDSRSLTGVASIATADVCVCWGLQEAAAEVERASMEEATKKIDKALFHAGEDVEAAENKCAPLTAPLRGRTTEAYSMTAVNRCVGISANRVCSLPAGYIVPLDRWQHEICSLWRSTPLLECDWGDGGASCQHSKLNLRVHG